MSDTNENCTYGYDYENKCDCREDDNCGCTFPNNMPHDFDCRCGDEDENFSCEDNDDADCCECENLICDTLHCQNLMSKTLNFRQKETIFTMMKTAIAAPFWFAIWRRILLFRR